MKKYYKHKTTGDIFCIDSETNDEKAKFIISNGIEVDKLDSSSELKAAEYNWAKSELESSDIEIKYHERNSKRAKLTVEQWYEYQEQLRDYATVENDVYSTSGDRPTRPS